MGYFLTASAYRSIEQRDLHRAILKLFTEAGALDDAEPDRESGRALCVYPRAGEWTVVLWPDHFNEHDIPVNRRLSEQLKTVVSTVQTVDEDYWAHVLLRDGRIIDRYCSWPSLMFEGEDEDLSRWSGDAEAIGRELGVHPSQIAPYFVQLSDLPEPAVPEPESVPFWKAVLGVKPMRTPAPPGPKAFPEDESDLTNWWVFVDMWKRLGITYPDVGGEGARVVMVKDKMWESLPRE